MNPAKGLGLFLEPGVELCQALLPLRYLQLLNEVAHIQDMEQRVRYLQEILSWSAILRIAVGFSTQQKEILAREGEPAFRSGWQSPVMQYFCNAPLVTRHWLIAHHLYWSLEPQRINTPWALPAKVLRFFRPNTTQQHITADDHVGLVNRILDTFPPFSQSEAFAIGVGMYRCRRPEMKKHYEAKTSAEVVAEWTASVIPMRDAWKQPEDSHWNLSRIWWDGCMDYVNAMLELYDVRMDFQQHPVGPAFPGRTVVTILSLGRRDLYYVGEGVEMEDLGQRAMDHCAQWMMGTARGRHIDAILALKPPITTLYRDLLRALFFRRLRIQAQWDAAASRGANAWAEGRYCGRLVYLEKKNLGE